MILIYLCVLASSAYGLSCEPRWWLYGNGCYKRLDEVPGDHARTCRNFNSILLTDATGEEKQFVTNITIGGPLANGKGGFVCRKNALHEPFSVARTRPHPKKELDCAGNPNWFGLSATKKCYSRQFSHQPLTWTQANTRCKNWFEGTLATLKTDDEYNHVMNVAHEGTHALVYEQPLVGLYRNGTVWKWVDGTQGGYTTFHGGVPGAKDDAGCAQLVTDRAIISSHKVIFDGDYGRLVGISCTQRVQRFVCSVDHATFVRRFTPVTTAQATIGTTGEPSGNGTQTGGDPELYCPPRWIEFYGDCYRAVYIYKNSETPYDCTTINSYEFLVLMDFGEELYYKFELWREQTFEDFRYRVCSMDASPEKLDFDDTLPNPTSDFDCLAEGWYGLNETDSCYKLFTDLENMYTFAEANTKCGEFGGSLANLSTAWTYQDFFMALSHTGVPAFMSELPALSNDDGCGRFGTDEVLEMGGVIGEGYEGYCALTNSYICEVSIDEMERRYA